MTFDTLTENQSATSGAGSCGSGSCGCGSAAPSSAYERTAAAMSALAGSAQTDEASDVLPAVAPAINGIALLASGESLPAEDLLERAHAELLRQEAVRLGMLPRHAGLTAPELSADDQAVIDRMLEAEVASPQPTPEEAQRYYDAHQAQFTVGQARRVRHILFAVTPGVNVPALAQRAEAALLELSNKSVQPERFAQLAAELSNCPSGAQGGDLGWLTPQDCAPEFAKELFFLAESSQSTGLRPRLVHTRFGFHIVDVLEVNPGHLPLFEQLKAQIAARLQWQSRATALGQYMRRLVGLAQVEGLELDGDASPLVQ
ncbi:MAG: peptidylprolyl isomerase [Limnohabitans sp.]|uniref:peptidylprolyl isomerase n=1 Tax=Limnohabitans sp. TaxID=1907725 RepID=UPI003BAE5432